MRVMRLMRLLAVVMAAIFLAGAIWSAPPPPAPNPRQGFKIVICPLVVEGGKGVAKEIMHGLYKELFEEQGFDVTMGVPVELAMQKHNIRTTGIPTDKELLTVGQELKVDYVLFAHHKVDTKRIWVNLLPRPRSRITIDPTIVDIKKREVVYNPKNKVGVAKGGSNLQTGVGWVISLPVAMFMGGSRSKAERQAAEKSVKEAYQDFFDSLTKGETNKIK